MKEKLRPCEFTVKASGRTVMYGGFFFHGFFTDFEELEGGGTRQFPVAVIEHADTGSVVTVYASHVRFLDR